MYLYAFNESISRDLEYHIQHAFMMISKLVECDGLLVRRPTFDIPDGTVHVTGNSFALHYHHNHICMIKVKAPTVVDC